MISAVPSEPGGSLSRKQQIDARLAWEVELDRLELDIIRAERLVQAMDQFDEQAWAMPDLATPMPDDLLPRALEIQQRQLKVVGHLVQALNRSGRQQSFASQVSAATRDVTGPAYIDLTA